MAYLSDHSKIKLETPFKEWQIKGGNNQRNKAKFCYMLLVH